MTAPFVWFDNIGSEREKTTQFLSDAFGWSANDIGPMTILSQGQDNPFAGTCDPMDKISGWVPYVEVEDLDQAATNACEHGATLIAANLQGPAGTATFVTDPGGAPIALWKRGEPA